MEMGMAKYIASQSIFFIKVKTNGKSRILFGGISTYVMIKIWKN